MLEKAWSENLSLELMYLKIKNEYDVTYKKHNVEQLSKNNKITFVIIATILVVNILTIIYTSLK